MLNTKVVSFRVALLGNLAYYIEDYNVSLAHVVDTVTVRTFYSKRLHKSIGHLLIYISKPIIRNLKQRQRERERRRFRKITFLVCSLILCALQVIGVLFSLP